MAGIFEDIPDMNLWHREFRVVEDRLIYNEDGCYEEITLQAGQMECKFPGEKGIWEDLQLIYGIGETIAARLKNEGFQSIKDLLNHPRWGKAAAELERIIYAKDTQRLLRYGASDLQLLCFFNLEDILFVDIETTGLYYMHPLFLVGTLWIKDNKPQLKLLLARDYSEEKAVLNATFTEIKQAKVITSYNGRSFDLPYLKGRMRFHNLAETAVGFHLDLLKPTRRQYRNSLPNCRLLTIERELLASRRVGDIPGSQIAEVYQNYVESGNSKYIEPILFHNACDLLSMAKLLGFLAQTGLTEETVNGN